MYAFRDPPGGRAGGRAGGRLCGTLWRHASASVVVWSGVCAIMLSGVMLMLSITCVALLASDSCAVDQLK